MWKVGWWDIWKVLTLIMCLMFWLTLLLVGANTLYASEWGTLDTTLFGSLAALQYVDYRQTLDIAEDNMEANHLLGTSPSDVEVGIYFLAMTTGVWVVADQLTGAYRTAWLLVFTIFQAVNVDKNWSYGYTVKF